VGNGEALHMTRMNLLTDVAGVLVGHATDLRLGSGVTAIIFEEPVTASASILGGAPSGRDTALLASEMTVEKVDAIVLSGGSAFGLEAAGGVQAMLREIGRGFEVAGARVPLVPQAILFDMANGGEKGWGRFAPYLELGHAAAIAASGGPFPLGSVGAGAGATTATVKGGLGSASTVTASGHLVAAIMAVNAVGAPTIGDGPWFWAAPYEENAEFGGLGWPERFEHAMLTPRLKGTPGTSTTIGLIVTDAALTKAQAHRLAIMAHDGLARAVLPAHAPMDGDTIFAASTGTRELAGPNDLTELGHAATLVTSRAMARGVFEATALPVPGAQPSWRDRFGR
jgi:L-aminopeptidase/D-esterase-like protein